MGGVNGGSFVLSWRGVVVADDDAFVDDVL